MARISIDRLTQEETAELVIVAIAALPEELLLQTLAVALTDAQRAELAEAWSD